MAWNDPGNSPGKRNPWEKRPGKKLSNGQTGMDELIKHFKKKFSSLFGSNGNSGTVAGVGLAIGVVLLAMLWASTGMFQANPGQVAVITRFDKFERIEQAGRGLHLPWPIEDVQLVNTVDDQHKEQLRVLTRDETLVDVVYAVRFRRADVRAYVFNVRDPDSTLDEITQSVIREVFAHETLSTLLGATRQTLATQAYHLIQNAMDSYQAGIVINGVDVVDVRVPSEVRAAQDEVTKAQADSATVIAHAREYASDIIPKANGNAAVIRTEAEGYRSQRIANATGETEQFLKLLPEYQRAPVVTRERLYLETMESIYANAKKVFVDAKGNNINLSFDKGLSQSVHDSSSESKSAPASTVGTASANKGAR
jgi:membrane protease subunit HflK